MNAIKDVMNFVHVANSILLRPPKIDDFILKIKVIPEYREVNISDCNIVEWKSFRK